MKFRLRKSWDAFFVSVGKFLHKHVSRIFGLNPALMNEIHQLQEEKVELASQIVDITKHSIELGKEMHLVKKSKQLAETEVALLKRQFTFLQEKYAKLEGVQDELKEDFLHLRKEVLAYLIARQKWVIRKDVMDAFDEYLIDAFSIKPFELDEQEKEFRVDPKALLKHFVEMLRPKTSTDPRA